MTCLLPVVISLATSSLHATIVFSESFSVESTNLLLDYPYWEISGGGGVVSNSVLRLWNGDNVIATVRAATITGAASFGDDIVLAAKLESLNSEILSC